MVQCFPENPVAHWHELSPLGHVPGKQALLSDLHEHCSADVNKRLLIEAWPSSTKGIFSKMSIEGGGDAAL